MRSYLLTFEQEHVFQVMATLNNQCVYHFSICQLQKMIEGGKTTIKVYNSPFLTSFCELIL